MYLRDRLEGEVAEHLEGEGVWLEVEGEPGQQPVSELLRLELLS